MNNHADDRNSQYAKDLEELRSLFHEHEGRAWDIGDRVLTMRKVRQVSFERLSHDLALPRAKRGYLNVLSLTAEMFPTHLRTIHKSWTWYHHDKLRRAIKRQARGKQRECTEAELAAILRTQPKTVRDFSRENAKRKAKRRAEETREATDKRLAKWEGVESMINRPHHSRFEDVIARLPNGVLDGMFSDPPFLRIANAYAERNQWRDKALAYECENSSTADALATTLALFDYGDKFTDEGFILLFQEGGLPLDRRILARARRRGWEPYRQISLVKLSSPKDAQVIEAGRETSKLVGAPAPSMMNAPFAGADIQVTLFFKKGFVPQRLGDISNPNVFFYYPITRLAGIECQQGKIEQGEEHIYECPPNVVYELLRRLLPEKSGQLIIETHACTAPATINAIKHGWRWIACEANAENYRNLTTVRIEKALEGSQVIDEQVKAA